MRRVHRPTRLWRERPRTLRALATRLELHVRRATQQPHNAATAGDSAAARPRRAAQLFDDPDCFSFCELFPGGFTPCFGGEARGLSPVGGVHGSTAGGLVSEISSTIGAHEADLFVSSDTVNASLGPEPPTAFDRGSNPQQEVGVNFDVCYATDMVNVAGGAEWRDEQYQTTEGRATSWTVGPCGRG